MATSTVSFTPDVGRPPAPTTGAHAWWVYLMTGVLWLVVGFGILSARDEVRTVKTVAVLAGIMFVVFAIGEFGTAVAVEGWRWLHLVLAIVSLLAATVAFLWPGQTFLTLAAIIGWYVLTVGVLHIWQGFASRGMELWWAAVVVGVSEIILAFWAIGYPGRSIRLLLLWVSLTALGRGLLALMSAFSMRSGPPLAPA